MGEGLENVTISGPGIVDGKGLLRSGGNAMFGTLPSFGFFIRHATGIKMNDVAVRFEQTDTRPAFALRDVADVDLHEVQADKADGVPTFVLDDVDDFTVAASSPVAEAHLGHAEHEEL